LISTKIEIVYDTKLQHVRFSRGTKRYVEHKRRIEQSAFHMMTTIISKPFEAIGSLHMNGRTHALHSPVQNDSRK